MSIHIAYEVDLLRRIRLIPLTIKVTPEDGAWTMYDDGAGNLVIDGVTVGAVNYVRGSLEYDLTKLGR